MIDFENTAGLRISGSRIQIVELCLKTGSIFVKDINEVFFNETLNLAKDKETKTGSLLQSAFDELVLQNSLNNIYVSFSLPLSLFYTMQIPFDQTMVYTELIEEFRWQFSLIYPQINSRELLIQYYPVQENDFTKGQTVYVSAVPRSISNIFTRFCQANNLKLRFIDSSHTASDKALFTNYDLKNERLVLSLMVEDKNLSFIFYSLGEPFLFSKKSFNTAAEIPKIITEEITKNNFQSSVNQAFIIGDELTSGFIDKISSIIGIPFNLFNPFSKLQADQRVLENKFYLLKNNSFSPAVGISIRSL